MKIVFLDSASLGNDISFGELEACGNFKAYAHTSPQEIIGRITGAEVVIVNKVIFGKEQFDNAPDLKLICVAATGMNNIDLDYAKERGIIVKNAVNYSTESVVQATFASLLSLTTNISYFDNCVKSGTYSKSPHFTDTGRTFFEFSGKRFGIIGMGTIGKRVAAVASAFGAEVVYYSTNGVAHCAQYKSVSLEELLKTSHIVSIHAPLNERTQNLITIDHLKMMKPNSFIANMGRGGIINESDLALALNRNIIAGAAIDVFSKEPIPLDHPYFKIDDLTKIVLTPHIAWASKEARALLVKKIAANIIEYVKGRR